MVEKGTGWRCLHYMSHYSVFCAMQHFQSQHLLDNAIFRRSHLQFTEACMYPVSMQPSGCTASRKTLREHILKEKERKGKKEEIILLNKKKKLTVQSSSIAASATVVPTAVAGRTQSGKPGTPKAGLIGRPISWERASVNNTES